MMVEKPQLFYPGLSVSSLEWRNGVIFSGKFGSPNKVLASGKEKGRVDVKGGD